MSPSLEWGELAALVGKSVAAVSFQLATMREAGVLVEEEGRYRPADAARLGALLVLHRPPRTLDLWEAAAYG